MEDCIFCKIAQGEMESEKIFETENTFSFLDINPRSPGHSLVIPKKHVETLTDLSDDLVGEIFATVKKVENRLKDSLNPDGFTIGINDGKAAGQEVPHLHVNIIPRFEDDGGKPIHAVVNNPPEKEISQVAEKIRGTSEISQ